MKRGSRVLSNAALEWAYEKWLDGYSLQEIADALYVTRSCLDEALKEAKYTKVKPPLHPPKELFKEE